MTECWVYRCDREADTEAAVRDAADKQGYRFHYCAEHWKWTIEEFPGLERVDDA